MKELEKNYLSDFFHGTNFFRVRKNLNSPYESRRLIA